jgi:hypothetical protein
MANPEPAVGEFHLMPMAEDARPRLVFRVGITGHRNLAEAEVTHLRAQVGAVLDTVRATIKSIRPGSLGKELYADAEPVLQFLSPLAEGADRIGAEVAVARSWRLIAPLPFFKDVYERDFPNSVAQFRTLLDAADAVIELDEVYDPEDLRKVAYLEIGKYVVRHSDLIIAIWNGKGAAGVGGTAEIVTQAENAGIPVVHIDSVAPHQIQVLPERSPTTGMWQEQVATRVMEVAGSTLHEEAREAAETYFTNESVVPSKDDRDFYYRGLFRANPRVPYPGARKVFGSMVKLARRMTPLEPPPAPSTIANRPTCTFLYDHFQRADCLATAYSEIHRGVFVLVYSLGAFALIAAFLNLLIKSNHLWHEILLVTELLLLSMILVLYLRDRRSRWRERWLDYRLLAEMLREADMLALLGRRIDPRVVKEHESDLAPQAQWVPQAFRAILRAGGVIGGCHDAKRIDEARNFADGRLTDQINYHERNGARMQSLNHVMKVVTEVFFFATIVVVAMEVAVAFFPSLVGAFFADVLAVMSGVFPVLTYAIFGIRNQAEFEIVGRRSERMRIRLKRHLRAIRSAGPQSRPLAEEMVDASEAMRHDVADWIGIFEMKETDK